MCPVRSRSRGLAGSRGVVVAFAFVTKCALAFMVVGVAVSTLSACGEDPETSDAVCGAIVGDLVVSELLPNPAGPDGEQEWIEIYNASSTRQILNRLEIAAAGDGRPKTHSLRKAPTLDPGEYVVLGNGSTRDAPIDYSYGSALALANTSGSIALSCRGQLVDQIVYGVTSGAPEPAEGKAVGVDGAVAPDALLNDRGSVWCEGTGSYDGANVGSPGEANALCGLAACEGPQGVRDLVAPTAGALIVSEVFADPEGVDEGKEWLELFVAASSAVDLNGLTLEVKSAESATAPTKSFVVASPQCLVASPGAYVVVAAVADPGANGGVVPAAVVPSLSLTNAALSVRLVFGSVVVDEALVPAAKSATSQGVKPAELTASGNDVVAAYCSATTTGAFSGKGTPGTANDTCSAQPLPGTCSDGVGTRNVVAPTVGALVVTEVFADPAGADADKEWVELYVASATAVDLNGLTLKSTQISNNSTRQTRFDAPTCIVAQPGTYVVLGAASDSGLNGGVSVAIANGGLELFNAEAGLDLLFDAVSIDTARVPGPLSGVSLGLDVGKLAPADNDVASQFCAGTSTTVFTGKGTPGRANDACAPLPVGPTCRENGTPRAIVAPAVGDLVLSEVLADPSGSDNFRDWVEVYVKGAQSVDLNGLVLRNKASSTRSWTLGGDDCVTVAPGAYAVLGGANAAAIDGRTLAWTLGGAEASVFYNSAATLELASTTAVIDAMSYPAPSTSKSFALSGDKLSATDNDLAASWCVVTATTPGAQNLTCP